MNNRVTVSCPGSCGELLQGFIGPTEYLVTLPVAIFNTVSIEHSDVSHFPTGSKLKQAFDLTCDHLSGKKSSRPTVSVTCQRGLPISKGMSSSTADVVAMIHGTARLLERKISEQTVATICCQIEKTDSLLFTNLTAMDSTSGNVLYQSDWLPKMKVLV